MRQPYGQQQLKYFDVSPAAHCMPKRAIGFADLQTPASFPGNLIPKAGYSEEVWNFQQFTQDSPVEFSFSFDTDGEFPTEIFKELAKHFPRLAFDCHCIEALDDFRGYGWFNPPFGGESFRQGIPVPPDYWDTGCPKRTPEANKQHDARIKKLIEMLIADAS